MTVWWMIVGLAFAKPPAPEAPPPPVVSDARLVEAFAGYDAAIAKGDLAAAADEALAIADDPAKAALQGQALARLGTAWDRAQRPYAAILAWSRAMAADPTVIAAIAPTAVDRATTLGDATVVAEGLVDADLSGLDAPLRARLGLLCAKERFQAGELGASIARIDLVGRDTPEYGRAQALKGVVIANQGRPAEALAPLLTAEAVIARSSAVDRDENLDVVELNLARAYYAAGDNAKGILYWARVQRGGQFWPEATFERAWAHFRLDDMPGTLALLQNQESPFLDQGWWLEADLLRIYALFLMCKFPTAGDTLAAFESKWTPIEHDLGDALATATPATAFADLVGDEATDGHPKLPERLMLGYRGEDRTRSAQTAVGRADAELAGTATASGSAAARATEWVRARREAIVAREGGRILAVAQDQHRELKADLANASITKLDIMTFETRLLEHAAAGHATPMGDRIGQLRKDKKRGTRSWAFEGEYWADELGYYVYDVRPDCPDGMRSGG